jgi:hypothetical protein
MLADRTRNEQAREATLRTELDGVIEKLRVKTDEFTTLSEQHRALVAQQRANHDTYVALQEAHTSLQEEVEAAKRRTPRAEAAARKWQQEVALATELETRAKNDAEKARTEAKEANEAADHAREVATTKESEANHAIEEAKRMSDEVKVAHDEAKHASEQAEAAIASEQSMKTTLEEAKAAHIAIETQLRSDIESVKQDMERLMDREARQRSEYEAIAARAKRDADAVRHELSEVVTSRNEMMSESEARENKVRLEAKQAREELVKSKEREANLRGAAERIESEWSAKLLAAHDESERVRERVDKLRRDAEEKEARARERGDKLRDDLEAGLDRELKLSKQIEEHEERSRDELKLARDEANRAKEREKKARNELVAQLDEAKRMIDKANNEVTAARVREDAARREAKTKEDTWRDEMTELRAAMKTMMETEEATKANLGEEMKKTMERQRQRDETLRLDREAERQRWNDELSRLKEETIVLREQAEHATKNEEKMRTELEERRARDRLAAGQQSDEDAENMRRLIGELHEAKADIERVRGKETRLRKDLDEKESKWRDENNRLRDSLDDMQRAITDERAEFKRLTDELKAEVTRREREKSRLTANASTNVALEDTITKLKHEMVGLRGEAQVAQENEALAQEQIATLQAKINDHTKALASGQASLEATELENGSLRSDIAALERRIGVYQSQIEDLQRSGKSGAAPSSSVDSAECPICGQLRSELASLRVLVDEQSRSLRANKPSSGHSSRRGSTDATNSSSNSDVDHLRNDLTAAVASRDRAMAREQQFLSEFASLQSQLVSRQDALDQASQDNTSLREALDRMRHDADAARDRWRSLLEERKRSASTPHASLQAQQVAALLEGDEEDTQVWPTLDTSAPVTPAHHAPSSTSALTSGDQQTLDELQRELAKEREGHAQASLLLSRLVRRMNRQGSGVLPSGFPLLSASTVSSPSLTGATSPPISESPRGAASGTFTARHPAAFSPARGSFSGPSTGVTLPSPGSGMLPSNGSGTFVPPLPRRMSSSRVPSMGPSLSSSRTSAPGSPHLQPIVTPTPMSTPQRDYNNSGSSVGGVGMFSPPSIGGRHFFASPYGDASNSMVGMGSPSAYLFPGIFFFYLFNIILPFFCRPR